MQHKKTIFKAILIALIMVVGYKFAFPSIVTVFQVADATKRKVPIYAVDTQEKKIAISFDASWGSEKTGTLLDILDEYNIKSTFFLCGYWIDEFPDRVKEIYARGHEIGNHSETHPHSAQLGLEKNKSELATVHEKIKDLINVEMNLYRPPFGEYNNTVIQAADELGYYTIQWSIDSHDWMNKGVDYEVKQVLNNKNLKEGAIILFHNDADDTPKALPIILDKLIADGYTIVPVSQVIYHDNFYIDSAGIQKTK